MFCSDTANSYRRRSLLAADALHPTAINYLCCPHTHPESREDAHLSPPQWFSRRIWTVSALLSTKRVSARFDVPKKRFPNEIEVQHSSMSLKRCSALLDVRKERLSALLCPSKERKVQRSSKYLKRASALLDVPKEMEVQSSSMFLDREVKCSSMFPESREL